jgi:dihydropyrimidinase
MGEYDLVVRGGTVATGAGAFRADVGIRGGRVAAVAERLEHDGAPEVLDAGGLLVLPGGVDTHCHLEQLQPGGLCDEESFATGSASALAGGTTTAVTFSAQFKGHRIRETLAEYRRRAERGAMIDYGFHQIVTDPTDEVVREELPEIVASGIRSLKVFLTYDPLHLDDRQFLRVLAAARRAGALVTVHCENYHAINWRTEALLAAGLTAPKYHAWSRPPVVEREATHRAIALAELVDQPIQVFHVSCEEAAEEIARAQARGLKVWGETCPQYLVLTAADMDRPGFEGAKFMCSPRRARWRSRNASGA